MTKDQILNKIISHNEEWDFITKMLPEEEINAAIEDYENSSAGTGKPDICSEIGLEMELRNIVDDCLFLLMRRASMVMWMQITKDQANNLIKAMHDVGVTSITMPNGRVYSLSGIKSAWESVNESRDE